MFDDPEEAPSERPADPAQRAKEKGDELRMHAEIFAVFEGRRKFGAEILIDLDDALARDIQNRIARLEKTKEPESPLLSGPAAVEAAVLLEFNQAHDLTLNDYHIRRRPGEAMIVRWLEGEQVESFYQRMQAHMDAGLGQYKEDERQSHEWKQDPDTQAYLAALEKVEVKMADRYLRDTLREHNFFILSTLTADEMDILHLCDYVMDTPAAEVVGPKSAPPSEPTERDRAWFFKLFSLRGVINGVEKMLFFTYLQKTEDTFDMDW